MEPAGPQKDGSGSSSASSLDVRVNARLIVYKLFYFAYWGAVGCFLPYLSLYFKQLGFSPTVVGLVSAARPFVGFAVLPFLAAAADRCRCRRLVLLVCVVLGAGVLLALAFLPPAGRVGCGQMEEQIEEFLGLNVSLDLHPDGAAPRRVGNSTAGGVSLPAAVQRKLFADQSWMYDQADLVRVILAVGVLATLVEVAMFGAVCQGDIATLDALRREHGSVDQYGWNRGFGTLGWGVCSFTVGLVLNSTHVLQITCGFVHVVTGYWLAFVVAAGTSLVAFVSVFFFGPYTYEGKDGKESGASTVCGLATVVFSWHYGSVIAVTTFLAVCNGSMWGFLYWHLDNLGGSQSLLGSLTLIQCLSDFFFGYLSAWLIGRFGHVPLLAGGLLVYVLRFFYYSWVPAPWLVIFSEAFHGLASVLTWITTVAYMNDAVPPAYRSTMQGILVALYNGLGSGLGFFLSGLSVSSYGAPATFGLYAVVSSLVLVVYLIIQGLSSIPPSTWRESAEMTDAPAETESKEMDLLLSADFSKK